MDPDWANQNLQIIRTLMERAAIYRRALGPMMLLTGAIGAIAAVGALASGIGAPRSFILYWLGVSVLPIVGSFLLLRRQALRDSEPMWSPPARRVLRALLPAIVSGLAVSLWLLAKVTAAAVPDELSRLAAFGCLPAGWVLLYGCSVHAAGFFMPRGINLFGWIFIVGGGVALFLVLRREATPEFAHGVMGLFFGLLHLAYGVYLFFTEQRRGEA